MPYIPARKATLLIPSGPSGFHLYVILTDACDDDLHLIGSICSIRRGTKYDSTCVIKPGEHKFCKHDSYFLYRRLITIKGSHLTKCVDGWEFKINNPVSNVLYKRICDGIEKSSFTPRGMEAFWAANKS